MGTVTHPLPNTLTDFAPRRRISITKIQKRIAASLLLTGIIAVRTFEVAKHEYNAEYHHIMETPPDTKAAILAIETGTNGRIRSGIALWLANKAEHPNSNQILLITGVNEDSKGKNPYQTLVSICQHAGMDSSSIAEFESQIGKGQVFLGFGKDTIANGEDIQQLRTQSGAKNVLVVTNLFHIPRSEHEAHNALGNAATISFIPPSTPKKLSHFTQDYEIMANYYRRHGGVTIKGAWHYVFGKPPVELAAVELPRPQTAPAAQAGLPQQQPF